MAWCHTHVWQIKIGRDISAAQFPPKKQGAQPPHQDPQLRVPVPGIEVPITSHCKNQWGLRLRKTGSWSPRLFILKDLCRDLLRLTFSEFEHWGSSLKGTREIGGRAELSGIKERAGGTAFSQTEVLIEAIVLLRSLPYTELAGRHHI